MDKITKSEAERLCEKQGYSLDTLAKMVEIMPNPRSYTFTVEQERQYAIKVLNVISNLKQKERDRVLHRAIKLNKI
tara:strand:+ start:1475 stop:1702 length:228 start_codon:yes stop_codon:yes gene_type:complete